MPRKAKTKTPPLDSSGSGFWFDDSAAERACEFFERFQRHAKGEWAGQRFALSEWQQRDIIRWKRPDGTRKYRKVYVEVARKNGWSTLGAGIALYLLLSNREPGAEICWEEHEYATRLLAGVIQDGTYPPIIYSADPEEDWTDPQVWARANPGLGERIGNIS